MANNHPHVLPRRNPSEGSYLLPSMLQKLTASQPCSTSGNLPQAGAITVVLVGTIIP